MTARRSRTVFAGLAALLLAAAVLCPRPAPAIPVGREADVAKGIDFAAATARVREMIGELVATDTTNPPGNEARAVAIGKERLEAAGIPYTVTEFAPGRENLVARLAGDGSKEPLLLLAHIDVVGTEGQDWSTDPKKMVEVDGYLVGRGVGDDFGMAALELETLVLLKKAGVPLARDVILAWTGDEESGGAGIQHVLEKAPESVRAELALNEGGGLRLDESGKPKYVELQTAEKTYQDFTVTARGPTGHSSVPLSDNAIYRLAAALARLAEHAFPPRLLPVTRAHLEARAPLESPDVGAAMREVVAARGELPADALAVLEKDPALAASLRTTCVATMIEGGTRANALPASATATVNCRILPDESPTGVQRQLAEVFADPKLEIEPTKEFGFGDPSPLDGPGPVAIRSVVEDMYPGLPIVPFMSRGATDSRFLRAKGIPAYGMNPLGVSEADAMRAHGVDERIPAASLEPALEFLYRLVVELAAKKS